MKTNIHIVEVYTENGVVLLYYKGSKLYIVPEGDIVLGNAEEVQSFIDAIRDVMRLN